MIKINLPRGLKYKIENANPGIFTLESDREPLITIYGPGIHLQYQLISIIQVNGEDKGDLTNEEILEIEDEIRDKHPKLFAEANIMHFVKFVDDSPCYYDFHSEKLYGANGVREKKGPIKGEPFRPSPNVRKFIEDLTEVPNVNINVLDILEHNQNQETSFSTIWLNFLKLDSSIRSTFLKVSRGICTYTGNKQTWQVGEEIRDTDLTLIDIFSCIAYRKIVATFDSSRRRIDTSMLDDIGMEDILNFLGLNGDVFEPSLVDIEMLITKNQCTSVEILESLLKRYSRVLESVWNLLIKKIETNLSYTFSASSYFDETLNLPVKDSDLIQYDIPVHSVRWNNALERACASVKSIIQSTRAGVDFFMYCKKEVTADSVIEYISALVLISFCYCKTPTVSENTIAIKAHYKNILTRFIQTNFEYDPPPPSDNGDIPFNLKDLMTALQHLLSVREQLINEGQYAKVTEIDKVFDALNLKYNDENSLLPPTMNR